MCVRSRAGAFSQAVQVHPRPGGDKFLECAPELEGDLVVFGDQDRLGLGSYLGNSVLTPQERLGEIGKALGGALAEGFGTKMLLRRARLITSGKQRCRN